ncbi:MAG: AAA family ATPase [Gammaproteobacteria bacterium]|nr:AAA family ATPase [Gammaproteobacteria bacterium]
MRSTLKLLTPQASGIVYASAGTGKTWLLISRLIRLLLDEVCPSSILAITFTNKAADEIRERVAERILEWNTQTPAQLEASLKEIGIDDVEKYSNRARHLYEQLLYSVEQVQITTFHAFCQKLIALCPLQSDAPVNFQIVENAVEWQEKAIDLLFETTTVEDKELAEALDVLYAETRSINNVRTAMRAFLARQNDWLNYVSDVSGGAAEATEYLSEQLAITEIVPINQIWQEIRDSVVDYATLLGEHRTKKNVEHAECLEKICTLDELSDDDYIKFNYCINTGAGEPRQRKLTKTLIAKLGEAGAERLINLCYKISDALGEMRESINRTANYRLNRAWYIVGSRLLAIYTTLKQRHSVLDFDDLEITASKLLTQAEYGSHWLQYRLASRIEHILIDEFQDTNPTQWQLLQPLMQEIASQKGGSVFIVGDRKQSIYGFRRADPELQVEAGRWLKEHLSGNEASTDISYRSADAVINFVNQVFGLHSMLSDFKQHKTMRDIKGGIHIFDLFEPVAVDKTDDSDEWRNPLRTPLLSSDPSHAEEATTVAQTIAQLYENKLTIEDSDGPRAIEYRDILIIARQKTHFDLFTRALRGLRIPVISSYEAGLFSRLEITDMLQLLASLHNPYNDLALAQVLRSPIYSLTDRHLLELGCHEGLHYFTKLKHLAAKDKLWADIYSSFKEWRALCGRLPIHDLLYTIFDKQNLIRRYRASVHPVESDQVQSHLETFLEYTLDYDSGRYPDVARFLDHVELAQESRGEELSTPQQQNCVQMMSIHGAKGLEAPVVFIIDCAFRLPNKETHDVLIDWPTDSQRPKHFLLMPPSDKRSRLLSELTATRRHRNRKEEINLLYVALTRAKQYLFISGSGKRESDPEHWYDLIKRSCAEQDTFGDDPLAAAKSTAQRTIASDSEASVDLELFNPEVSVHTLPQQVEPSRVGMDKKMSAPTSASKDAQLRGLIIHKALELSSQQSYRDLSAFKQALAAYSDADADMIGACAEEAWSLLQNPELKVLFAKTPYKKTYHEMPLLYEDDKGQVVYGKVDQVCVADDQIWIIDYKTNRPPASNTEQFYQKLAAHYLPQMQCYKEGVAKLFPNKPIKLSLLFTKSGFLYDYSPLDNSI